MFVVRGVIGGEIQEMHDQLITVVVRGLETCKEFVLQTFIDKKCWFPPSSIALFIPHHHTNALTHQAAMCWYSPHSPFITHPTSS
jgi:hypothetical protein